MRKILLSTAAAAGILSFAVQAQAAITATSGLNLLDLGTGNGAGQQSTYTNTSGITFTFTPTTSGVYSGSATTSNGVNGYTSPYVAPYATPSNKNYLVVEPNTGTTAGTVTAALTGAQTAFYLLWGTIDSYNTITFGNIVGGVFTANAGQSYTGGTVGAAIGVAADGGNTAEVAFTGLTSFNAVQFADTSFSAFEFDIGTPAAAVPEPVSLALLGTGLVGLGLVRMRKSRKSDAQAA